MSSDCAPLWGLVEAAVDATRRRGEALRFLRDPTRGGLTTVLAELAEGAKLGIEVEEEAMPVSPAVRSVCDLLGYDPLTLANEGKMIIVVAPEAADAVLAALRGRTRWAPDAARWASSPPPTPAASPCARSSAPAACSTCRSASCCRASAEPQRRSGHVVRVCARVGRLAAPRASRAVRLRRSMLYDVRRGAVGVITCVACSAKVNSEAIGCPECGVDPRTGKSLELLPTRTSAAFRAGATRRSRVLLKESAR